MKTSESFLKLYVPDLDVRGKDFAERITMTGTKIETYEKYDKNLSNIVVGKILKIEKHPNADKLVVCQIDIGNNNIIQICTGATNCYEGMIVPVVLDGGKVAASMHDNDEHPNGIPIKNGKLRGVDSNGMMCGIEELGKTRDIYGGVDGIYDLKDFDCKVGDDAIEKLLFNDYLYDFEITSNRVDCYSTIGIAREVAATFDKKFVYPNEKYNPTESEKDYVDIDIVDDDLCKCFSTRLIKNVKIGESPMWMKDALRKVGIRPINNIVDITNFVMIEYGQPLHAYDYNTIRDKKIIVRRADNNEKFVTLDGKEHILDDTMLTIRDGQGIIGLAGIMGGENSMITDDANTVLFEGACFNGTNIRLSSQKLGMRTEASNLFEKGLDPNTSIKALDRCCALIEELGIGDVVKEKIYVYKKENELSKEKQLVVDSKKVNSLIGKNIDKEYMKKVLDKVELDTTIDGDNLIIKVPTWRLDINNYADITEEILRFYGYDKINMTVPYGMITVKTKTKIDNINDECYNVCIYNGFDEIMNYSFESKKVYEKLKYADDSMEKNYIKIQNPLGEDFSIMRTQLVNGMLTSLATNYKRNNKNVRLFEIANIYIKKDEEVKILPDEKKTIILGEYGENIDFYHIKGIVEEIFDKCGINLSNVRYEQTQDISYLHPYRAANIYINDVKVGVVGEVHKSIADDYGIETRCYIANVDMSVLYEKSNDDIKYEEISKYPNIDRDLSMLVPNDVTVDKIDAMIKQRGGKLLKYFKLYDIYTGAQVKEGYKSLAYTMTFNNKEKSLKSEEVDVVIKKIINGLTSLQIELRS